MKILNNHKTVNAKFIFWQLGVNKKYNIIEMSGIKDMPNYIVNLYKDPDWKNIYVAFRRTTNEEAVMNCIDSNIRFYVNHIIRK